MHICPNHLSWNAQTVGKIDLHNRRETWPVKVLLKAPQILVSQIINLNNVQLVLHPFVLHSVAGTSTYY